MDGYISGQDSAKKLQTFSNTIGGNEVHAEAVTLVDQFGVPLAGLAVTGTVAVSNFPATQVVSGTVTANTGLNPLTDAQLRASPIEFSAATTSAVQTTATLAGAGTYTSAWVLCAGWPQLNLSVYSDVASATDGLIIEWSDDGSTVHDSDVYTVPALNGQTIKFGPGWEYFRLRYVNGASPQTVFRLRGRLIESVEKSGTHRIADRVNGQQDSDLVCAVIKGAGTYALLAGTSGSQAVPDGYWIIGIAASSATTGAGTITGIPGQSGAVQVPGSTTKTSQKVFNPPLGTCIASGTTITFTGTDSYEVECLNVA